ncbi:unnamed protein product [Rotaria sordida]|uniref:Uncharacterized protein n=1 Tax=Rotaria sordida TaxID=392033 RepID=A0A814AVJ8_9BILA|nr:unnamed protein product [Rotaria sordida]CAF3570979.1 unnamed protein product [Rotaria sordida]
MTYNLKKDHLKNLDTQQINGKSMIHITHDDYDDDQDIYISERSSIASSSDMNQVSSPTVKRLPTPTPTPSSLLSFAQKQPHNVRCHGNELQEKGIPITTQCQLPRKQERKKKKSLHKTTPGQGTLAPLSETKPYEIADNYYPYWGYYQVKNPDWIIHHRQTIDGQIISNESLDPSQYVHQPALITSSIQPKQQPRKSRQHGASINRSNQDKQRHDRSEKNSPTSSHLTFHDCHDNNYQQQQQHILFENSNNDEHREQTTKRTISQQRRKLKIENDSTDHNVQSHTSKLPQNSNSLIITSNSLTNRSKNRTKTSEKNADIEENSKHRHSKHCHHHHHQNHIQSHNSPSIPSQQNNHHQNLHVRRRPPSGSNHSPDLQIVDTSTKKSERSSYFQQTRESFHLPATPVYNQSSYLPPIIRDHHHHPQKTNTNRFPTEYYGTLARQTHDKDWEEPIEITKIYKPGSQTRFYDRYLNNVVDKRLAV